jgi:hypothetical protein
MPLSPPVLRPNHIHARADSNRCLIQKRQRIDGAGVDTGVLEMKMLMAGVIQAFAFRRDSLLPRP